MCVPTIKLRYKEQRDGSYRIEIGYWTGRQFEYFPAEWVNRDGERFVPEASERVLTASGKGPAKDKRKKSKRRRKARGSS